MPYSDAASQTYYTGPIYTSGCSLLDETVFAEVNMLPAQLEPTPINIPTITETEPDIPMDTETQSDHLLRTLSKGKGKRPDPVTRGSLPTDVEDPKSPPPTEAVLSPVPPMNKLHAGHTPLFPGHFSPAMPKETSEPSTPTPEHEDVLTGPLTLPALPGDGAEDRIELRVLTAELEKVAMEQLEQQECKDDVPTSKAAENVIDKQASAVGSEDSDGVGSPSEVDGVILKKPKMNLGAPLGQV